MSISAPALLSYLLLIGLARAQVSAPNCTDNDFSWTFNSLQQNPCWVMAYLAATCNNGSFYVPPLPAGQSYNAPTNDVGGNDVCKCNTVVYNLISACDACQGETWTPYTLWTLNCSTVATPQTFPNPVPIGTRVPKWAYIDSSIGNNWNISLARSVGDSPEVTGSVFIVPTSTTGSTLAPSGVSSSPTSTSHSSSNSGAVAGGVVGAALIAGAAAWLVIRRRRAGRAAPSSAHMSGQVGEITEMGQQVPYPLNQRLYDPSDPRTYPSKMYLPMNEQRPGGSTSSQQHSNDGAYVGLPEI
ncbi:hypothetical protein EI94DRAFT_1746680 [Lactarius quietus]|nr:hypothetical protein EI94DRAFT_1746680 [Lactarius quietus]